VDIRPKECSVNSIIADCVDLLSPEMARRQTTWQLDLDPKLPRVSADPSLLVQIFINLIRNASDAMDKEGILNIKTFEREQDIQIEFKNRASSAKIKQSELLFLPFVEGGRSIGLPLSYRLLEDMGGLLSFAHEQDFMIFTVSLPKMG